MTKTITLNMKEWMISEIQKRNFNRSEFIREAIKEYVPILLKSLVEYKEQYNSPIILTVNMNQENIDTLDEIVYKYGFEFSKSELVRNAVRLKLSKEPTIEEEEETIKVPIGYDYIEGFNGNNPFKTRRLE